MRPAPAAQPVVRQQVFAASGAAPPARPAAPLMLSLLLPAVQNQGNSALKTGLQAKKKFYLRQAIEQYDKGLEVRWGGEEGKVWRG